MRDNRENEFVPKMFVTLTYKGKRWAQDDIDIDVRKYVVWLMRKLNCHMRVIVGYELGDNTHLHLVMYSPDLGTVDDSVIEQATCKRAWNKGRVKDAQPYDLGKGLAGVNYTLGHRIIPFAGEVFCPCRGKCRKGLCPYPQRLETLA